ncbi:DUF4142 domain-containing protein [Compostibacter hankyongensis]|uniref:DUF4142 domain-containing protein n=1 Tax=Compostibacter hankyongensis TaxID=1007089 RepID=A0ABP8FW23_9BACT
MKKIFVLGGSVLLLTLTQACNNGSGTGNGNSNVDTADSMNAASAPVEKSDADFMVSAAIGGMSEVEMGRTAQQKATNPRVSAFGAMMVNDHSKANDSLKTLAARKSITLPDSLDQAHRSDVDKLSSMSKGYDKAYIDDMVKDHEKDIDEFEKGAQNVKDPDIQAFITQTLPVLRTHLDSAKAIQESLK